MKMLRTSFSLAAALAIGLSGASLCTRTTLAQSDTPKTNHQQVPIPYVDIRAGFSIQLPAGWQVAGDTPATSLDRTGNEKDAADLADWEILKLPASRQLVRFNNGSSTEPQNLIIHLLALKHPMTPEEILTGRKLYWEKRPATAKVLQTPYLSPRSQGQSRVIGLLSLAWRAAPEGPSELSIHEALIQTEPSRYFLLQLATDPNETVPQETHAKLMLSFTQGLTCSDEPQVRQRWTKARKRGQTLLGKLDITDLKKSLAGRSWYRLIQGPNEVGFYTVQARETTAGREIGKADIQIDFAAHVTNAPAAAKLARMLGWSRSNDGLPSPSGPVRLTGTVVLDHSASGEQFNCRLITANNGGQGYREQGRWDGARITTRRFDDLTQDDKYVTTTLNTKEGLYLPWSAMQLINRQFVQNDPGEYVFMYYGNRTLSHCAIRVLKDVNITRENTQTRRSEQVNTTYLVAQLSADGPIVESWLDQNGRIVRRRSNGVTLERCPISAVKRRWSQQLTEMQLSERATPPRGSN